MKYLHECASSPTELISNLMALSLDSLRQFYIPDKCMFARSGRLDPAGKQVELSGASPFDTANILVALNRLAGLGYDIGFDTDRILRSLVQHCMEKLDYGDVSWILWADSVGSQRHLDEIWTELEKRCAFLADDPNGLQHDTMRMAWLLTALCHYYPFAKERSAVRELSERVKECITGNFNSHSSLFYASKPLKARNPIRAKYRNTLATLSAQTFTITALVLYYQVFADDHALNLAVRCADTLCQLQGPQGQWWRIYNVVRGKVAGKYPVYSVNQDATVPMALLAVQRALSTDKYDANVRSGLEWVLGNNELNLELIDWERRLIWRGIGWRDYGRAGAFGFGIMGRLNTAASAYLGGISLEKLMCRNSRLYMIKETYSYHPARLIIAFSENIHEQKSKPGIME